MTVVLDYLRTRWFTARVLALAAGTAVLAAFLGHAPMLAHGVLVGALVLALRLLDDLLDWHHDRVHHPRRAFAALTRGQRRACLGATLAALAALAAAHLWLVGAPAGLAALVLVLALAYLPGVSRPLREAVLLAKYPALVVLGAQRTAGTFAIAAALWGLLLAVDAIERRRAPAHRARS